MTISFNRLNGEWSPIHPLPELDDLEFFSTPTPPTSWTPRSKTPPASPWPLSCFKALLVVAWRKRIGHASPAIPITKTQEPGSMVLIDCGRAEGNIGRKLALLRSCKSRRGVGRDLCGVGLRPSGRWRANLTQTHIRSFMATVALLRIAVLPPLTLPKTDLASIIDAERLRVWAFGKDDSEDRAGLGQRRASFPVLHPHILPD